MATSIIGRQYEQHNLKNLLSSNESEFIAVYGRIRVGKTFLIKNMIEQPDFIHCTITGKKDGEKDEQLSIFTKALEKSFRLPKIAKPTQWSDAFERLTEAIETISKDKTVVIFLDELPWLYTQKSGLLGALDHYWNTDWAYRDNLKLIICGSAASWMLDNIVNDTGGLHDRLTAIMSLRPFTLAETAQFLKSQNIKLNQKQICELYMIMGGIPYYLKSVKKGLSAIQNIENLCFSKNSFLSKEFENLYNSLFKASEAHKEIIRTLAKNRYGMSQDALLSKLKLSHSGGSFTTRLKELQEAGFIFGFTPYQHTKKGRYYRILDEYSLFYLTWIEPVLEQIQLGALPTNYWQTQSLSPAWRAWSGYAFEALCYKHIQKIQAALKIQVGCRMGTWRHIQKDSPTKKGAQIDLLFDRDDGAITLCEIKYSEKPYRLTKQTATEIWDKQDVFVEQTNTKKQIFQAMVTTSGLTPNLYSEDLISNTVTLADLFKS